MTAVVANFIDRHSSVKSADSKEKVQNMLLELMDDLIDEEGKVSVEKLAKLDAYYVGNRIQKIYGLVETSLVTKR